MLLLSLVLFLPIVLTLFSVESNAQVNTENEVEFVLHKRMIRDVDYKEDVHQHQNDGSEIIDDSLEESFLSQTIPLNGATFQLYELTEYYEKHKNQLTSEEFVKKFAAYDRSTIKQLITDEQLEKVGEPVTTALDQKGGLGDGIARITVPRKNQERDAVYLIFEESIDREVGLNVDVDQHAIPIVAVLPIIDPMDATSELSEIHIYPKNIGYLRDPYFFKYGRQQGSKETGVPLSGTVFALYQLIEGKKFYLDMAPATDLKNKWIEPAANDPLGDENVSKFISDKDGLVSTGGRFLPAGTYYFEELKSVDGYTISEENKKIEVIIPESWQDANGEPNYVTINGQKMAELESGNVPAVAYKEAMPRVYNEKTEKKLTEDSDKSTTHTPNRQKTKESTWWSFPKTNEGKTLISLVGILLLIGASLQLKKERGEKND